jgi:hypothetical protein
MNRFDFISKGGKFFKRKHVYSCPIQSDSFRCRNEATLPVFWISENFGMDSDPRFCPKKLWIRSRIHYQPLSVRLEEGFFVYTVILACNVNAGTIFGNYQETFIFE